MGISQQERIQWRKDQILQLLARGHHNHREIAAKLQIPKSTVSKDILILREESKANLQKYIDERLPEEYERIMTGLTAILKEAWDTSEQSEIDTREKIQALSLAKECYSMKLDLLTNTAVLNDASSFVAKHKDKMNKDKIEDEIKSEDKEKKTKLTETEAESTDTTDTVNKVF